MPTYAILMQLPALPKNEGTALVDEEYIQQTVHRKTDISSDVGSQNIMRSTIKLNNNPELVSYNNRR